MPDFSIENDLARCDLTINTVAKSADGNPFPTAQHLEELKAKQQRAFPGEGSRLPEARRAILGDMKPDAVKKLRTAPVRGAQLIVIV